MESAVKFMGPPTGFDKICAFSTLSWHMNAKLPLFMSRFLPKNKKFRQFRRRVSGWGRRGGRALRPAFVFARHGAADADVKMRRQHAERARQLAAQFAVQLELHP